MATIAFMSAAIPTSENMGTAQLCAVIMTLSLERDVPFTVSGTDITGKDVQHIQ